MLLIRTITMRYSRPVALTAIFSFSSSSTRVVGAFSPITLSHLDDVSWLPNLSNNNRMSDNVNDNVNDNDNDGPPTTLTFPVHNPAEPSQVLAQVPIATRADVSRAIERSDAALPQWRDGTTPAHRASLLTKWSQLIQQHKHDIATIMTLEAGKTLAESLGEVTYGTSFIDYYAAEIMRPSGSMLPAVFSNPDADDGSPRGQAMTMSQAVGVTGLIAPWNFPIAMITRKVAPALAAGCTALVKPSELTPLTALLLQELADQAGIPKNVVQTM
jgi:succinate-semialdehyde dehydrogenase/glutarate-semialdehyde dehydrogenase